MFLSEQSYRDIIIAAIHAKSGTPGFNDESTSIMRIIQETVDALIAADHKLSKNNNEVVDLILQLGNKITIERS